MHEKREKLTNYLTSKSFSRPLLPTFGGRLSKALLDYYLDDSPLIINGPSITVSDQPRQSLQQLIATKHNRLIDLFSGNGYQALKLLLGSLAPTFRAIWVRSFDYSYQTDWHRRPFRTKNDIDPHLSKNLNLLRDFIQLHVLGENPESYLESLLANAQTRSFYENNPAMAAWIAYELDSGNEGVRALVEECVLENNGAVSRIVLLALMQAGSSWAHELAGKLLLAAKLQEGLRQSIVEVMDGGTPEAFIYLLNIIIDNKLERFSSVVRAFDVWTGLQLTAEKPAVVRHWLIYIRDSLTGGAAETELDGDNPVACYLTLMCTSFHELDAALQSVRKLLDSSDGWRRALAFYWLSQIQLPAVQTELAWQHIHEQDPLVLTFILMNIQPAVDGSAKFDKLFNDLERCLPIIPSRSTKYSLPELPAASFELKPESVLVNMLRIATLSSSKTQFDTLCGYVERMSIYVRRQFITALSTRTTTAKQRTTLLQMASDKSSDVRDAAAGLLARLTLTAAEYLQLESMLRFKTESLRKNIMGLLLKQEPTALLATVKRLHASSDDNSQRAAAQLVREIETDGGFASISAAALQIISSSETVEDEAASVLATEETADNGMGLFNPRNMTALADPAPPEASFSMKWIIPDLQQLAGKLQQLSKLVEEHKQYEYEVTWWDQSARTVVFGTEDYRCSVYDGDSKPFSAYPLHEIFAPAIEQLFPKQELDLAEFAVSLIFNCHHYPRFRIMVEEQCQIKGLKKSLEAIEAIPYFSSHLRRMLTIAYHQPDRVHSYPFYYSIAWMLYNKLTPVLLNTSIIDESDMSAYMRNYYPHDRIFGRTEFVRFWVLPFHQIELDDAPFKSCFYLESALTKGMGYTTGELLPIEHIARAYETGLINRDVVCFLMTQPGLSNYVMDCTFPNEKRSAMMSMYPEFFLLVDEIVRHIIQVETKRGELPSPLSQIAGRIHRCHGADLFVKIVNAMDNRHYVRGYNFPSGNSTKGETLSFLLKNLYPAAGEGTAEDGAAQDSAAVLEAALQAAHEAALEAALEPSRLKPQQLIDAAMYAPQWLAIVEQYLQIPGLRKMAIWFHAHLNEAFDGEKQAVVARYSSISAADFKAGAFDLAWFKSALEEIGEKQFRQLYNSAKYIAGGSLHKRSQLFSDAVMGKLDRQQMEDKVSESRNKDSLLAYTLIPIADDSDALQRYWFLMKFKQESKQYGAQRRQSEALTTTIGIDNLARNAGYADATRFIWQMETKRMEQISHWFTPVKLDEAKPEQQDGTKQTQQSVTRQTEQHETKQTERDQLELSIGFDKEGVALLNFCKNQKRLASVPAAYKKHPLVMEGQEVVKSLREQQRRGRSTLEQAMINRDAFRGEELLQLCTNPVIAPMLQKILFLCEEETTGEPAGGIDSVNDGVASIGLIAAGKLVGLDRSTALDKQWKLFIAHPADLLHYQVWEQWQSYYMQQQIKQPFKQVFRELYTPTPDERYEKTRSRRYAGHQLMPQKAAALAGARGWSTSDGLFKVYYKDHIVAEVFSGIGWFTAADVEPATIEIIQFHDNQTNKPLSIDDIPPVIFSETMRDLDLLVSSAHYGGVDPEASLSTIEMRRALLAVLLPLLKLDQVVLKEHHAFIKGSFGEYTVHLGSGVAHMQAKGAMPIVPVHSGQRGRVFLPFADDDPKTAEIISKIQLLAEDKKIKDPSILAFIRG